MITTNDLSLAISFIEYFNDDSKETSICLNKIAVNSNLIIFEYVPNRRQHGFVW